MRERHPKVAVSIGVPGIEPNRLAKRGFSIGVLSLTNQTTASLLLTLRLGLRGVRWGWEGGGVGLRSASELGVEIAAACFLGKGTEKREDGSVVRFRTTKTRNETFTWQ
jgi:hypothetical protein